MDYEKIKKSDIKVRKKWLLDPTTKVEKSVKGYNRADYKREIKTQLEQLEDESLNFEL